MESFAPQNNQNKDQKPQTKIDTKTIKQSNRYAALVPKLLLPALILLAGFFITILAQTKTNENDHPNDREASLAEAISNTDHQTHTTLAKDNESSNDSPTKHIDESSAADITNESTDTTKIKSSISVSASSTQASNRGQQTATKKVTINGTPRDIPRNGKIKTDCRDDQTRSKVTVKLDNDNSGNSSINISNGGACGE